jgi:hypothetical protein
LAWSACLSLEGAGGGLQLIAHPAQHVVDAQYALQAAAVIDNRDPPDRPLAHFSDDGLDVVVFVRDDKLVPHDIADLDLRRHPLGMREDLNDQIAIGEDADRPWQGARLVDHDDHIADAVLGHSPSDLGDGLLLRRSDHVANAQFAGSHAVIVVHRAFQERRQGAGFDWRGGCITGVPMFPFVEIQFCRLARNPSLESAIHRWVARLEAMQIAVRRADVTVEAAGRRRTSVSLAVSLADRIEPDVVVAHADPYVAIAEAFRVVRRQVLARQVPSRVGRLASGVDAS